MPEFSAVPAYTPYFQDKDNNAVGDRWQSELIAAVREGSRQRDAGDEETQRLRNQGAELEARIARIESAQASALPGKRTDAATRRATSPGSPVAPP